MVRNDRAALQFTTKETLENLALYDDVLRYWRRKKRHSRILRYTTKLSTHTVKLRPMRYAMQFAMHTVLDARGWVATYEIRDASFYASLKTHHLRHFQLMTKLDASYDSRL